MADYVDAHGNLKSDYDAATAHLGAPWRMMTQAELDQLANCPRTPINTEGAEFKDNGDTFAGYRVSGQGDYSANSIFLPAAGCGDGSSLSNTGGRYWSSTPRSDSSTSARLIYFTKGMLDARNMNRYLGCSVRAVRDAK